MTAFGIWWCEAYGPPDTVALAASWPRCFFSAELVERRCPDAQVCATEMAAERARVFTLIHEQAADGDEAARYLAGTIGTPGDLLNGGGDS